MPEYCDGIYTRESLSQRFCYGKFLLSSVPPFRLSTSSRHVAVHHVVGVAAASPVAGASVLMQEGHHRVGGRVAVVERRRRTTARRRARHWGQAA